MQTKLRTGDLADTDAQLAEVARRLAGAETYYLDTEFESNRSGKTLSIVQIATADGIHLVDALRLRNLEPLGRVLGRAGVTWVVHAGLQDVELLEERLDLRDIPRLFDTQIAWAMTGPEPSVSLAYLKYRVLGIRSMKPHQADDWMRRPLPTSQLEYAASDVEHLPALHAALSEQLRAAGRESAALDACRELLLPPEDDTAPPLTLASFRNAWQLDRRAQAALRFLIAYQQGQTDPRAQLGTKPLLAVASRLPRKPADLSRIKGVPEGWVRRHGDAAVAGIRAAIEGAREEDFEPIDPPAYATWQEVRIDGWLSFARAEVSARTHVAPELAFSGRVMRAMRRALAEDPMRQAAADVLEGWRRELLREPYLALCRETPGSASLGA